jgi:hypothetical protein
VAYHLRGIGGVDEAREHRRAPPGGHEASGQIGFEECRVDEVRPEGERRPLDMPESVPSCAQLSAGLDHDRARFFQAGPVPPAGPQHGHDPVLQVLGLPDELGECRFRPPALHLIDDMQHPHASMMGHGNAIVHLAPPLDPTDSSTSAERVSPAVSSAPDGAQGRQWPS